MVSSSSTIHLLNIPSPVLWGVLHPLEPQLFLQDLSQGEKLWCLAAKTLLPPTRSSHQAWRNPQPQVLGPCRDRRVSTSSYELSGLGNPEELSTEGCPCPSAHQDPLDQRSAPHGIRPCLLPTPTKNALRSNLPRYQRFFFSLQVMTIQILS